MLLHSGYFEITSIEKHPRICFFSFHSISVWNFENISWTFKKCSFKGSILDVTVNLQLKVPVLMISVLKLEFNGDLVHQIFVFPKKIKTGIQLYNYLEIRGA